MRFRNQILILFAALIIVSCILFKSRDSYHNESLSGTFGIVSLSPSITREIVDLGKENIITGTANPEFLKLSGIESVGMYLNPDIEKIIRLNPDIVFLSAEDLYLQKISLLMYFGLNIVTVEKNNDFNSMCKNYQYIAQLLNSEKVAIEKIDKYRKIVYGIDKNEKRPGVVFLVSVRPLVSVSEGSHINAIINDAGGYNLFIGVKNSYPILSIESLILANPDAVIVMNYGDDVYLYNMLSEFKKIRFIEKRNIFIAGDENIPYYTPSDYAASVEKVASILKMINK